MKPLGLQKRQAAVSALCCVLALVCAIDAAAQKTEWLWHGIAPGSEDAAGPEQVVNRDVDRNELGLNRSVSQVSRPTITTFLPPPEIATGAAVVICPGDGFRRIVIDKEGYDVAKWLNALGVVAVVLKYRTGEERGHAAALSDARRAVRLVRSRAEALHVDPGKIGLLGFSAGGQLAAMVATQVDKGRPDAPDPLNRISARPDFLALIYAPVPDDVAAAVTEHTPPTFLIHADDDSLLAESGARFYLALRAVGVPAELHVYTTGGHGFGLGVRGGPVASWPGRLADWLRGRGR